VSGFDAPLPRSRLYVLSDYPHRSQTFVRNEIVGLRKRGLAVDVLSIGESGDAAHLDPDWVGPYRLLDRDSRRRTLLDHAWFAARHPRRYVRFLASIAYLREHGRVALRRLPTEARRLLARASPPGGCHTHFGWSQCSITAYLALLLGVPASITLHANDIYVGDAKRLARRLRLFRRLATVCNFNVGLLSGLGIIPVGSDRVEIVPCGVDVPATVHTPHPDGIDIACVGRLVEKKGFDVFLHALASTTTDLAEVRAVIAGEGPEEARLRSLAEKLGLNERVRFAGALDHRSTLELIASASVFCLPSRRAADGDCDAVPVVLREALARGVPVISTALTGIPETVDAMSGWLVRPGDATELASTIRSALSDESERLRRGAAGRRRVAAEWTLDDQVSGILHVFAHAAQVISTLAGGSRRPPASVEIT
jgi:colanic acid/amylovoran biosynthesis glycosyltransferase